MSATLWSSPVGNRDQLLQFVQRRAAVERFRAERDAVLQVPRLARDDQGGRRVEQRDVAERSRLAFEYAAQRYGVRLGVAPLQRIAVGARQSGVLRRHF